MDEMSQEATASSSPFSNNLIIKKKEDGSKRVLLDTNLLNQSMHRLPLNQRTTDKQEFARKFPTDSQRATANAMTDEANFRPCLTTAEKDEITREVSAISDRAAARIMDDDDDEFQRYVEATAKYGRTPTGLKFDHYSNADFIKRMNSRASARSESITHYKGILDIERMKSRVDQLTEQILTGRHSRSTLHRSEGRASTPTDLTEYSANSDEIRKSFALST
jgi:hypothetical protein